MIIATDKRFTDKYWFSLKLNSSDSPDWEKAIEIFKDRILGRFILPVNYLQSSSFSKIKSSCGFTVLAIDCLLIETLIQFYKGIRETNDYYFRKNSNAFSEFFLNSSHFNTYFDSIDKARIFYSHIRCGILHQGQTKGKTTVSIKTRRMIEWLDINDKSTGFVINRRLFHKALVAEFNDYCEKLLDPKNRSLRLRFKKKMDLIANAS